MPILIIPPDLTSSDAHLALRTVDLNRYGGPVDAIIGSYKARPIARYVGRGDIEHPPAPAWYLPAANDLYIHVEAAGITDVPEIHWATVYSTTDANAARIVGLFCHEAAHAAISDDMTPVQMGARHHFDLLNLLEELRVENYAVRRYAGTRRFLRASFAIVLGNLPEVFENKSHVVRAWAIARGRTLAGIAAADETDAVDIAARTLLGDDVVDGLTDLLQEALTLRLDQDWAKVRIVEICDEWVGLVGEAAETTGCTHCAREAKPGEETGDAGGGTGGESHDDEAAEGGGSGGEPASDTADEPGAGGGADGDDGDDSSDDGGGDTTAGMADSGDATGTWGKPGGGDDDTSDDAGDALSDEDAELMGMLARDLADLMQDEWTRDLDSAQVANRAEWAAKVFGNRKRSTRVEQSEPTSAMRRHVVEVAQALSRLSLPTVTKVAKASTVPPGRLRSREALRASAERAQGKMVSARPWKGSVRRHSTARPLVIGIATDTSGSMRWAEEGVAEFAYVYTNAGHRVGARTAAVTFGSKVYRIARPGEVMTHVERKTANDAHEEFDHAIAALDGVLHLTDPAYAARILLVISDGALVKGGETEKAAEWLRRMDKAGTHVLWIGDRDIAESSYSYSHWLTKLNKKLPNLTVVTAEGGRGSHRTVFDVLNGVALDAIRANVL